MKANSVLTLKWIPVDNWKSLNTTGFSKKVEKADVVNFVERKIHEISNELNIPYGSLKPIIESENKAFFSRLKKIFKGTTLKRRDPALTEVLSLLKLPDVSSVPTADRVISMMRTLSPEERKKVFDRFDVPHVSRAEAFLSCGEIIE